MEDKVVFYTAVIAAGTWATVICALLIVWLQNRATKRLTCLQLFIQLASEYDSVNMHGVRRHLANKLLSNPAALDLDDSLLVFYENLAILSRRRLLDRELVWNTFVVDVRHYWAALRHYVGHARNAFSDPTMYEEFEWLSAEFERSNRSPLGNWRLPSEMTPTDVQRFLDYESHRGDRG